MGKSVKLSIVTAYYNRKELFLKTLDSIQVSERVDDIELIVVDDASEDSERLEDIQDNYKFPIRIIRQEPEDKNYINPCIPYNLGFPKAKGDLVLIQNPECFHVGDLISTALEKTTDENYIVFAAYALSKEDTEALGKEGKQVTLLNKASNGGQDEGWYNHSIINPRPLHFASCITKKNLEDLGGFDEAYADGIGYDDDELLMRIKDKGLKVEICDNPLVLHQNHYNEDAFENKFKLSPELFHKNRELYLTEANKRYKPKIEGNIVPVQRTGLTDILFRWKKELAFKPVKKKAKTFKYIPKIAHFYWEGDKFSYLHFLSVKSFIDKNPGWRCIMHTNIVNIKTDNNAWNTGEQKAIYTGKNYFSKLKELDIEINKVDFKKLGIKEDAHPVHKSDLLRWYLLGSIGGAWVDSDILHLKPIDNLSCYIHKEASGVLCWTFFPIPHFIIGFFLSKPNNKLFQKMFEEGLKEESIDYQMYGNRLLDKVWSTGEFDNINMKNFHPEHFYIHPWLETDKLFEEKHEKFLEEHVLGVHWFNGDPRATEFCNKFDESYSIEEPKTTIEAIIYECTRADS